MKKVKVMLAIGANKIAYGFGTIERLDDTENIIEISTDALKRLKPSKLGRGYYAYWRKPITIVVMPPATKATIEGIILDTTDGSLLKVRPIQQVIDLKKTIALEAIAGQN
jgi:hypothetical protein